jgi:hypothetical protein
MNLPDSFYIALCMTVLLLGVVYWFWSQTQFLLRKINLLENIVYELKTVCMAHPVAPVEPVSYPPAPSSVTEEEEELLHEELLQEEEESSPELAAAAAAPAAAPATSDDLQPGGVGSGLPEVTEDSHMLEGMTLKELRRLGEQRGIAAVGEMKKKDILAELKRTISKPAAEVPSILSAFKDEPLSGTDVIDLSTA